MPRIGFIGAQGTGKTTLIKELAKWSPYHYYSIKSSPTRMLHQKFGMDFSSANTDIQLATLCLQTEYMSSEYSLLDRTVVDNFAYLKYHRDKGLSDLSENAFAFIEYWSKTLAQDTIMTSLWKMPSLPTSNRLIFLL